MTTETAKQPNLEALADEDLLLAETEERVKQRRAEIKATLIASLPLGTHTVGARTIQVRAGARRLNLDKVMANHPYESDPELYVHKLDTTAVKHHIAPAELDGYKDDANPTVVVK